MTAGDHSVARIVLGESEYMKANGLRTAALLGGLSGLLLLIGQALGGANGLVMGLVLAIGMNFFSYFFSEKMALMMYRAQPVTPAENAHVYSRVYPMVQELCRRMELTDSKTVDHTRPFAECVCDRSESKSLVGGVYSRYSRIDERP